MSGYVRVLDMDADDKANGIETIQIDHYESGDLPTGSVACLKDGRLLITDEAYQRLHAGYIASKRLTVSGTDAPTDHINPCPFCKGVGRVESVPVPTSEFNERNYFVRCGSCAAEGPWQYSETGAIRFWNMRTPA